MCRLSNAICNNKQIWSNDRCRCECKEDLIKLIKLIVIRDIHGILVFVNVNVINLVVLENTWIKKTVLVKKVLLIN